MYNNMYFVFSFLDYESYRDAVGERKGNTKIRLLARKHRPTLVPSGGNENKREI